MPPMHNIHTCSLAVISSPSAYDDGGGGNGDRIPSCIALEKYGRRQQREEKREEGAAAAAAVTAAAAAAAAALTAEEMRYV